MSSDKEKLSQLLAKVEEINATMNKMSEELRSVSASLKSLAVGQITQPPTVQVTTSPKPAPVHTAHLTTRSYDSSD